MDFEPGKIVLNFQKMLGGMILLAPIAFLLGAGQDSPAIEVKERANAVKALLQDQCISCHQPKDVAPFSLTDYESVKRRSNLIRDMVIKREMPPTFLHGAGGPFSRQRQMGDAESLLLQKWIFDGAPRWDGDIDIPKPEVPNGWQRLSPIQTGTIREEGVAYWEKLVFDAGKRKSFASFTVKPNTPAAVRQVILTFGGGSAPHFPVIRPERLIGVWAPQIASSLYSASILPPKDWNGKLVAYCLTMPTGKSDSSGIELHLQPEPGPALARWITLGQDTFSIPAQEKQTLTSSIAFAKPTQVMAVLPEGRHYASLLKLTTPHETLFEAPKWNLNWPGAAVFQKPITLRPKTKLTYSAFYDNSEHCVANENRTVTALTSGFGEGQDRFKLHVLISEMQQ